MLEKSTFAARAVFLSCCLVSFALLGGCGGNDVKNSIPIPGNIQITITGCDAQTFAAQGVICISFTATGPAGVFDLLMQYVVGATGPLLVASEIPTALENQIGVNSNAQNYVIPSGGQTISGTICWYAGGDLGFVAAPMVQLFLSPVADNTSTVIGGLDQCIVAYTGGGSTFSSSGTGSTPGSISNGRADHCAEHVGGRNIAVGGGHNASTVYDTIDRFTFDPNTFAHTAMSFMKQAPRTDHACSFYLDTMTGALKVLVTGGVDMVSGGTISQSADTYCFTPTEMVQPAGDMLYTRRGHSATWIPANLVVVIGGEGSLSIGSDGSFPSNAAGAIEEFDPATNTFSFAGSLNHPRRGHTATLLPNGNILVAGGFDPAAPGTPLPAEVYNPATDASTDLTGTVDRVNHTATRLANGWVLLAGGNQLGGTINSNASIYMPELGAFTTTMPGLVTARSFHAASLLGDGNVLLTGGETGSGVTSSSEIFLPSLLAFTSLIPMSTMRADHTSTAIEGGNVVVVGGRSDAPPTMYLDSIEVFGFLNDVPVVGMASTATSGSAGVVLVAITVTDADADGGYVIIRWRLPGQSWNLATIVAQSPSTVAGNFPNMRVTGTPTIPQTYGFSWNFAMDGLTTGQTVEVQVIPVGAVLGSPVSFTAVLP